LGYAASIVLLIGLGSQFLTDSEEPQETPFVPQENAITLEMSDGNVKVISAEGSESIVDGDGKNVGIQEGSKIVYKNAPEAAEVEEEELVYNTLFNPNGADNFELVLSDGTQVLVNAGSSLKFPRKFLPGKDRTVFLQGEAYFKVSEDKTNPFIVNTNEMDVRVLGTEFCVNSYENMPKTHVVLMEGSVSAYMEGSAYDSKNAALLKPGDLATIYKGGETIKIEQVDTTIYTAWMTGKLIFVKVPFQDMLKGMERKFNIKIINNYTELNKQLFTANFNEESLDQIMKTIQKYEYFDYEIIQNQFNENQLIINQTLN
jgi:ferric-dicitrate binding protein FerR (iron transport regulator)